MTSMEVVAGLVLCGSLFVPIIIDKPQYALVAPIAIALVGVGLGELLDTDPTKVISWFGIIVVSWGIYSAFIYKS